MNPRLRAPSHPLTMDSSIKNSFQRRVRLFLLVLCGCLPVHTVLIALISLYKRVLSVFFPRPLLWDAVF